MNILLSTDNNYVMPTGVLMHSIGINNRCDVVYYIMTCSDFTIKNQEKLKDIASQYGHDVRYFPVDNDLLKYLPIGKDNQSKYITIATYYRLFVTEILPKNVHKIIYLDGDIIVRKSLSDLWNTEISNYAIGAVKDVDTLKNERKPRLPYPAKYGYFNAGVLLINLDYWREYELTQVFVNFVVKNRDILVAHDQDVLNSTLYNSIKWLPITYNFEVCYAMPKKSLTLPDDMWNEILQTECDPVIIHYVGSKKPWYYTCNNPYSIVWRYYWQKSQWKNQKLIEEKADSLKDLVRNFAIRHAWYVPKSFYRKINIKK